MKYLNLITYIGVTMLLQPSILSPGILYAADSDYGEIREMSSRKNEQLFNKIAIDLLNGKSRFVSLDNMIKILQGYKVIEFYSEDIEPAQEIILKEVAFRMLKSHYLPRIGDKIKVYELQKEFSANTGIHPQGADGLETAIRLPLEIAAIKDKDELMTIYWSNLVMQISTAIEKLWLKRIGHTKVPPNSIADEKILLDAASLLRRKFIQGEDIKDRESPAINDIVQVVGERLESWLQKGTITKGDLPALTEMAIQYITLSRPRKVSEIITDLKGLKGVNDLKEALLLRIKSASETIKYYNPSDYGAFAMLQSLLNEISDCFSHFSNTTEDFPLLKDFQESRHSA